MSQFAAATSAASQAPQQQQQQQEQDPQPADKEQQANGDANSALQQSAQHKRVYQACIPCRRRKVRCDLGSVDNPNDPPCVRCRRESKECYFSATRRKRKHDEDAEEDYVIRNGRKKTTLSGSPPPFNRHSYTNIPLTPGGSTGRHQPLKRPDERKDSGGSFSDIGDEGARLENLEAQAVMRREVYGPHDALDLLYKAATDNPHNHSIHTRSESVATTVQPAQVHAPALMRSSESTSNVRANHQAKSRSAEPIDPRLLPSGSTREAEREAIEKRIDVSGEPGYEEALKAWGRFRFVRAGWFTREEAVKYIT